MHRQVWDGWVPIIVQICDPESAKTYEYLLKGRRGAYISQYLPTIIAYFARYLLEPRYAKDLDWWFEFQGMPLAWNWPIGVLYDFHYHKDPPESADVLPWVIKLRHGDYPEALLSLGNDAIATTRDFWMNQLKEAAYIRDGNSSAVMNISRNDSQLLWTSIEEGDFTGYWRVFRPLLLSKPRNIPLKLYQSQPLRVLHQLVSPTDDHGVPKTLGSVLHALAPALFPSSRASTVAIPVLHGVVVPLAAPLGELYDAVYPDGFLHICMVIRLD